MRAVVCCCAANRGVALWLRDGLPPCPCCRSQGDDSHEGEEEEEQPAGRRGGRARAASAGRGGRVSGGRSSGGRGALEGRGLVRSPRAMPGGGIPSAGRLDAGVPGGVGELLARLLGGPLFGGEPGDEDESDSEYGESDEDGYGYGYGGYGYSEEEDLEDLEELPRGCWAGGARQDGSGLAHSAMLQWH